MNMFKSFFSACIVLILMAGFSGKATAQRLEADKVLRNWSVTAHAGVTMPYTDVREYDFFRVTDPVSEYQGGGGVGVTRMFGSVFGVNVDYMFGKLQGVARKQTELVEDKDIWIKLGRTEPLFFNTLIHHPTVNAYINWSNMFLGLNRVMRAKIKEKPVNERRFSVFSRVGFGYIFFNSNLYQVNVENPKDEIPVEDNKYLNGFTNKATELTIPVSFGLKWKINKMFDLGIEHQFVFVNSDKLDALVANTVRGRNDKFSYTNLNFTYKFGSKKAQKEHLEWVNPLEAYMDETNIRLDNIEEAIADSDGDGIINNVDEEEDTPEGNIVDSHGVTQDSDGDGCPDSEDEEPFSTPLLPIENCVNVRNPNLTPEQEAQVMEMIKSELDKQNNGLGWALSIVFYDLDKSDIRTSEIPELYKVASLMKKYPDLKVNVKGHTDIRASDDYNMSLSDRRTNASVDYIVNRWGIARDRFIPGHFGESDNLFPNASKESQHWLNRRVEFTPANY